MQKPILLLCSNSFFSSRSAHRTWRIQQRHIFKGPHTPNNKMQHPQAPGYNTVSCTHTYSHKKGVANYIFLRKFVACTTFTHVFSLLNAHIRRYRFQHHHTKNAGKKSLWLLTLFLPMRMSSSRSSYGSSSSLTGNGGDSSLLLLRGRMPSSLSAMRLKQALH